MEGHGSGAPPRPPGPPRGGRARLRDGAEARAAPAGDRRPGAPGLRRSRRRLLHGLERPAAAAGRPPGRGARRADVRAAAPVALGAARDRARARRAPARRGAGARRGPRVGCPPVESHAAAAPAPSVLVDTLEVFVELLSRVEADGSSDAFYSRLCEATCRLASMDRAIIFRYDEGRRRVRAAGAYGISLDLFADAQLTLESAPIARQALAEDRVIEVVEDVAGEVPAEYRSLVRDATLVCTPLSGAGRW